MVWNCDSCGEKIVDKKDGWVEWKKDIDNNYLGYGLRLVHHNGKCQYNQDEVFKKENAILSDLDLDYYSSQSGLMDMLGMISENRFLDNEEVLEMIKRLHIDGYDRAKDYLSQAVSNGVFEPNTKPGYPSEFQIKHVLDWMDKNGLK